ncbi:MAG: hypothetical protein J6K49_00355 [Clostridia bacterium]|nr:hypothetical protein [Clostridia bacterium]
MAIVTRSDLRVFHSYIHNPTIDPIYYTNKISFNSSTADYFSKAIQICEQYSINHMQLNQAILSKVENNYITYPYAIKFLAALLYFAAIGKYQPLREYLNEKKDEEVETNNSYICGTTSE